MPEYRFEARDPSGGPQRAVATAVSAEVLAATLRRRGMIVLSIAPVAAPSQKARRWRSFHPLAWRPPTGFDIEIGLRQLAAMLHGGLTLLAALQTVGEQARRPRVRALWEDVARRIERGATFSSALSAHSRRFPDYVIQLVRVGESSGELHAMLARGADHLEQSRSLRLMVVNALAYPAIVVMLALGVSAFMVINVIPRVERFLVAGGRHLPPLTRALLDLSEWLRAYLGPLAAVTAAAGLALGAALHWPPARRRLHRVWLHLPVTGPILRVAETAAFARGMGVLVESGVPLLESLGTAGRLVRNAAVAERVAAARASVARGEPLAAALSGDEFLPMLTRMVAVGETTGALGPTLTEAARFHEEQLVAIIRRLGIIIEPVMIAVVGGIVGFVYVAFFVALFSLATGVH